MKTLWAPWRMQYLESPAPGGCFFCAALASDDEHAHLVLAREPHAVILLNKYPYGHGHLLIAPRRHLALPEELTDAEYDALMRALRRAAVVLGRAFKPEGMNVGMNLGRAAGAGVADHCHWHLVPRWNGDTNFMPLVGEVKVISEHLETAFERLRPLFA
jgi:ATP adenylyltransferase